jgi:hypothetical protein
MKYFCSLIVWLFLLFSCCTPKNSVYKQTGSQIFFGNSGGFTNATLEYVLNDDGNIFKNEKGTFLFIKKIKNDYFKEIKSSLDEYDFRNIHLNSPGNISYFIRVKTNEFENKVVWSDLNANKPVEIIYNKLFDMLKD